MKRFVLAAAAVVVAAMHQAVPAAAREACYSPAAMEADQAIRYMTDLMVISSSCQDTIYAEFRLRNQVAIRAYQKAMIEHFHGTRRFDDWNTALANEISMKHSVIPTPQMCQQSAAILARARELNGPQFRALAASLASQANGQYHKCHK